MRVLVLVFFVLQLKVILFQSVLKLAFQIFVDVLFAKSDANPRTTQICLKIMNPNELHRPIKRFICYVYGQCNLLK